MERPLLRTFWQSVRFVLLLSWGLVRGFLLVLTAFVTLMLLVMGMSRLEPDRHIRGFDVALRGTPCRLGTTHRHVKWCLEHVAHRETPMS